MRLRRRRPALLCCSIDRRTDERPPRSRPRQQSGADRFSRTASTVNAIGYPSKDIFYDARAGIGVKLIERPFSPECTVRGAEPFNSLLLVPNHLDGVGIYSCHAHGAVRFGRRQKQRLAQTTREGALRNAELS